MSTDTGAQGFGNVGYQNIFLAISGMELKYV